MTMKTMMELLNWTACGGLFFWLLVEALGREESSQMYGLLIVSLIYLFAFVLPILNDK
jgi:hypothetical protein